MHVCDQFSADPSGAHIRNAENTLNLLRYLGDLVNHRGVNGIHHSVIKLLHCPDQDVDDRDRDPNTHSIDKLINTPIYSHIGYGLAAAFVGVIANLAVSEYKVRVGRGIGSESLEADGIHSRIDALVSAGAFAGIGLAGLGLTIADPIDSAAATAAVMTMTTMISRVATVLFALVLVAAVALVTETAFVSVNRRRAEFGVLRAMGWSGGQIASLVEFEMLILGALVGAVALALGTPLVVLLGRVAPAWQLVLVIPLSIAVAGAAAALPALAAARGSAIEVVVRQAKAPRGSFPRSTIGLGLTDLRRRRSSQLFLSAGAMCLGAATLGILIVVEAAFRGQLDTTVLGTYLAGQVRPFHFALALLTSVIGAIAAGQVITLGALNDARNSRSFELRAGRR